MLLWRTLHGTFQEALMSENPNKTSDCFATPFLAMSARFCGWAEAIPRVQLQWKRSRAWGKCRLDPN